MNNFPSDHFFIFECYSQFFESKINHCQEKRYKIIFHNYIIELNILFIINKEDDYYTYKKIRK